MRIPGGSSCCAVVIVWTAATWACAQQNPNGQIPVAGLSDAYLILIRDPLVQDELRLNDRQRQAIQTVTDRLDGTLWTVRNKSAEQAAEVFRKLIAAAEAEVEPILSAGQRDRLAQIRLSVAGLQVLLRDDIAQKLDLSRDQRTRIEAVLKENREAADRAPGSDSSAKTTPTRSKVPHGDTPRKIAAILSREQLTAARELLGNPLDASRLGRVKFKAPELDGADGWLNSEPLTMEQLKGKVVALHFWTYG
ncbi:MAG: hypothetical protein JJ992_10605 [Planctomycetes bacterium]|nr:hypothetical protein [Planctomycetota bacterium]